MGELKDGKIPIIKENELWVYTKPEKLHSIWEVIGKDINLTGKTTHENWKEANELLSIYNNNMFETARYIIIKDNKIRDQITVSTGIPSSTNIYPHEWMIDKLKEYVEKTDSYILFVHNHPAGQPGPSGNDQELTQYLYKKFDYEDHNRFLGHLILAQDNFCYTTDKNAYAWYRTISNEEGKKEFISLEEYPYGDNVKTEMPNLLSSITLLSMFDFATAIMKESNIDKDKNLIALYASSNMNVIGVKTVNKEDLWDKQKELADDIRESAKKSGASLCYLILHERDDELFEQIKFFQEDHNVLSQAIMESTKNEAVLFHELEEHPLTVFKAGENHKINVLDTRIIRQNYFLQKEKEKEKIKEGIKMTKWEYKVFTPSPPYGNSIGDYSYLQNKMNQLGEEGWELLPLGSKGISTLCFKRPIIESPTQEKTVKQPRRFSDTEPIVTDIPF